MNETYEKICAVIRQADGVLIGASNGLSIAEGYHIFADDLWFRNNFGDFRNRYGMCFRECFFSIRRKKRNGRFSAG